MVFPNRPPSLGHLLVLVEDLANVILTNHSETTDLKAKLDTVEQLSTGELSALLASTAVSSSSSTAAAQIVAHERLSASDKKGLAVSRIRGAIRTKEHEEGLAGSAVEAAAFLTLRHLEFFLLHSNSSAPLTSYQQAHRRVIGED